MTVDGGTTKKQGSAPSVAIPSAVSNYILTRANGYLRTNRSSTTTGCDGGTFTTQTQLDAFSGCPKINGHLRIIGSNAQSLDFSVFKNLTEITGDFSISGNSLTRISGFSKLKTIGGDFAINYNDALTRISGFSKLTSIGGVFEIKENGGNVSTGYLIVTSISGFGSLSSSPKSIKGNTTITGFSSSKTTSIPSTTLTTISAATGGTSSIDNTGPTPTVLVLSEYYYANTTRTIPASATKVTITAVGGIGGNGEDDAGGTGAEVVSSYNVRGSTGITSLKIIIGAAGSTNGNVGNGGGFTQVISNTPSFAINVVAGGGGGGGIGGVGDSGGGIAGNSNGSGDKGGNSDSTGGQGGLGGADGNGGTSTGNGGAGGNSPNGNGSNGSGGGGGGGGAANDGTTGGVGGNSSPNSGGIGVNNGGGGGGGGWGGGAGGNNGAGGGGGGSIASTSNIIGTTPTYETYGGNDNASRNNAGFVILYFDSLT